MGFSKIEANLRRLLNAAPQQKNQLQEDLTDEMVGLAKHLKESSLLMHQSLQDTEKIIDSTERAVEHSLASTGYASARTIKIYSESFKTTCFTWLVIFLMMCIFFTVVLLIRVTCIPVDALKRSVQRQWSGNLSRAQWWKSRRRHDDGDNDSGSGDDLH